MANDAGFKVRKGREEAGITTSAAGEGDCCEDSLCAVAKGFSHVLQKSNHHLQLSQTLLQMYVLNIAFEIALFEFNKAFFSKVVAPHSNKISMIIYSEGNKAVFLVSNGDEY